MVSFELKRWAKMSRCGGGGFTLIELLTVMAIIIVLLGVTVPAATTLMKGNNQKQAVNMATAYIASARATAMSSKTPVALVFFEDPANRNQTAVQLLRQVSYDTASGISEFSKISGRNMEYLPRGVKVSVLKGDGKMTFEDPNTGVIDGNSRVILFDGSGQLLLRSRLNKSSSGNAAWTLNGDAVTSFSSPALIIYDFVAYKAATEGGAIGSSNWLQKNGDLLVINAYTGNVIR